MDSADQPKHLIVNVRDTGIGIAESDQKRLFTKFFRAEHPLVREMDGTGLGLSIARRIVELHGGSIWMKSAPEQGSTFSFSIPIANLTEMGNGSRSSASAISSLAAR